MEEMLKDLIDQISKYNEFLNENALSRKDIAEENSNIESVLETDNRYK